MSDFIQFVGAGLASLFVLYLAVRVASAAYFRSKQESEIQR